MTVDGIVLMSMAMARAVILAHSGRFNKESWLEHAQALAAAGFRALAIDFRGFSCSTGPGAADFDRAPFEKMSSRRSTT